MNIREAGVQDGSKFNLYVKIERVDSNDVTLIVHDIINDRDSPITTLVLDDLNPGTEYRFSIKIQNEFGSSRFSEPRMLQIQMSNSVGKYSLIWYTPTALINSLKI